MGPERVYEKYKRECTPWAFEYCASAATRLRNLQSQTFKGEDSCRKAWFEYMHMVRSSSTTLFITSKGFQFHNGSS